MGAGALRRRYRMCRYCGDIHEVGAEPDNCRPDAPNASECAAPAVHHDDLPGGIHGMVSMADGRRYDSKRRYERETRALGCEVVGNERLNARPRWEPPRAGPDIKRAIEELKSR